MLASRDPARFPGSGRRLGEFYLKVGHPRCYAAALCLTLGLTLDQRALWASAIRLRAVALRRLRGCSLRDSG